MTRSWSDRTAWTIGGAAVVVIALVLAWRFASMAHGDWAALTYPYGIDYGEGIVWRQAVAIPGPTMYGDITHYPFIVFHYPPLYHLAARLVGALVGDGLLGGRIVSCVSTLAIAPCVALAIWSIASRIGGPRARLAGALLGAGTVFIPFALTGWSALMRVDMLAIALTYGGLVLAVRMRLVLACLCFVAAVYTKQTQVVPAAAIFAVALVRSPRAALRAILVGGAVGLVALAALEVATGGGFLTHIIGYNVNRFDLGLLWDMLRTILVLYPSGALLAVIGLVVAWRAPVPGATAMVTAYFVATCIMLATAAKSGANFNYFIEWQSLWSVFAGVAITAALARLAAGGRLLGRIAPIVAACGLLVIEPTVRPLSIFDSIGGPIEQGRLAALVARIAAAPGPVLSDDMVLLMRAGAEVPLEPAIFAELSSVGLWDEDRLTDLLRAHRFAFLLTTGEPGDQLFGKRYNRATMAAMSTAYPWRQRVSAHLFLWSATPP